MILPKIRDITNTLAGTIHEGPLVIKRMCVIKHKVLDSSGAVLFESENEKAVEEFVSWYNIQLAEVIKGKVA